MAIMCLYNEEDILLIGLTEWDKLLIFPSLGTKFPEKITFVISPLTVLQEEQVKHLDGYGISACCLTHQTVNKELLLNIQSRKYSICKWIKT